MSITMKLSWWQIGLITIGVSALGGWRTRRSMTEKKVYTQELKQAPWAPPSWVFAPAWSINNYFLITALDRIISSNIITKKEKLLYLQLAMWAIFFSFNYVYFKKKSPVLAALWTVADHVLSAFSWRIAKKEDKVLSYQYLPLVIWTTYASAVAAYQALKNPDPIIKTRALIS